ncbi:unnamed protein product [Arabidopsis halleri]
MKADYPDLFKDKKISPELAPLNRRPSSPVTELTKPTKSLVEGHHQIRDDETKPETPSAVTADEPRAATRRKKDARDAHAPPRATASSARVVHAPPPVIGAAVRSPPGVLRRVAARPPSPPATFPVRFAGILAADRFGLTGRFNLI